MPKPVRFGVVGLGMGVHHCRAIREAKGAELVAVCDMDAERLRPAAEQYGVKAYACYADLLKDPEVDVVNVVTESGYHARMGMQAARAGKHIIMEKPIDVSPRKVRQFEEVVAETGVKCGCIFQSRMDLCNDALRKAIEKGKLGKPIGIHGNLPWYRGPDYFSGPHGPWRGTWKLDGGGSMMNQGIHTVDLLIFFGGPVESVCGFYGLHDHDIESEDQVVACLQFANGALGSVYTTTCAKPEGAQEVYCFGTKGSFRKHGDALVAYDMGGPKERDRMLAKFGGEAAADRAGADPMAIAFEGHRRIVEDMVQAVRRDRAPVIPLATARHAVEVVYAIYQSARRRKAVKISDVQK